MVQIGAGVGAGAGAGAGARNMTIMYLNSWKESDYYKLKINMKVLKKYNQTRRDCYCDMECESCGHRETDKCAYDDRNFWDNVVPNFRCKKCGKSTNDMGLKPEVILTRYPEGEQH